MARQLWILRHGDAEPHGARDDASRRLTAIGEGQAVAAGHALKALGVDLALAFTSPRVRALQTAALACEPLGVTPVEHEPLAGGFARTDALELLAAVSDDGRVLVIGHEPDLSGLVADLCGARIAMKKGGLAGVRVTGTTGGELLALLRPRELQAIAGTP